MNIMYKLLLDVRRKNKKYILNMSQNDDRSRLIDVILMDDTVALDMTGVTTAKFMSTYVLNKETVIFEDYATILKDDDGNNTNEVQFVIPANLTQNAVVLNCKFSLNGTDTEGKSFTLSTAEFYISIENALYDESEYASGSDIQALNNLINESQKTLTDVRATLAEVEDKIEEGIEPLTIGTTVYDGKTPKTVESLKNPFSLTIGDVTYDGSQSKTANALKNPFALTIDGAVYDGSEAKEVTYVPVGAIRFFKDSVIADPSEVFGGTWEKVDALSLPENKTITYGGVINGYATTSYKIRANIPFDMADKYTSFEITGNNFAVYGLADTTSVETGVFYVGGNSASVPSFDGYNHDVSPKAAGCSVYFEAGATGNFKTGTSSSAKVLKGNQAVGVYFNGTITAHGGAGVSAWVRTS